MDDLRQSPPCAALSAGRVAFVGKAELFARSGPYPTTESAALDQPAIAD